MAENRHRQRSPNFPSLGLADAILKLKPLYESQRMYPTNRETFAQLLGYRGLNGASSRVISSLSKYGLLEGYGDSLHVSAIGQDLVLHKLGDPEYALAAREAASRPTFFQELDELYPAGLPSDHALRAALIKRGFHEGSVEGALRSYRETMEFVEMTESQPTHAMSANSDQRAPEASPIGSKQLDATDVAKDEQDGLRSVSLPLSGSSWAELRGPFPITSEAWSLMMAVLDAMKPALTMQADGRFETPGRSMPKIGGRDDPTDHTEE